MKVQKRDSVELKCSDLDKLIALDVTDEALELAAAVHSIYSKDGGGTGGDGPTKCACC